jgi:pimeloyl-ACP methyl ester carboxylesterase
MTDAETTMYRLSRPDEPDGPLVVLVHGMEDTWESWRPFVRGLPKSWRVYALDTPWRAGNAYAWRRQATAGGWLRAAIERLGEPVDVLVGHSLGANSVLEMIATPGSAGVRTAVLLAPFYCPRSTVLNWEMFDEARKAFDRLIADGMRMRLGARFAELDADIADAMIDKVIERIGPQGFMAWFDHFAASSDLNLASVAIPTFVLAGSSDPCLSHGRAESLAADMPISTMRLDPTFDHFCHVRQARQTSAHLVGFAEAALAASAPTTSERNPA